MLLINDCKYSGRLYIPCCSLVYSQSEYIVRTLNNFLCNRSLTFESPELHRTITLTDFSVEREHSGLRQILGYGVTITRGSASAMMFTYSTLLITMCHNTITILRSTVLQFYIPIDSAIEMHTYIAYWALVFTGKKNCI